MHRSAGVIAGKRSIDVVLRFTPGVSSWIAEQEWHEAQEVSVGKDGSLHLRFPVSGFVEVAREILKYGAAVEVLEPRSSAMRSGRKSGRWEPLTDSAADSAAEKTFNSAVWWDILWGTRQVTIRSTKGKPPLRRGGINGIMMEMREFTNLKSQIVTSSWSGSRVKRRKGGVRGERTHDR